MGCESCYTPPTSLCIPKYCMDECTTVCIDPCPPSQCPVCPPVCFTCPDGSPPPCKLPVICSDPIVDMDCTTNAIKTGIQITGCTKSLYRTGKKLTSGRYYARRFTFRADNAGAYTINVSHNSFDPFITIVRDASLKWQILGTTLTINVTAEQTGPMSLEVTTKAPYTKGIFDVALVCDVCTKWTTPLVYFPFDADLAESTSGGRVWTPSGTGGGLLTPGFRGVGKVLLGSGLGAGAITLPDDPILNRPSAAFGDFTLRCLIGFNFPFSSIQHTLVLSKTEATLGAVGGPFYGWALLINENGNNQSFTFDLLNTDFGSPKICPSASVFNPSRNGVIHAVVAYNSLAGTITTYINTVKTITTIDDFIPMESSEPLIAANTSTGSNVSIDFDDFGIWDYAWTDALVQCDYTHPWQYP